jgi:hypothetical protein
MYLIVFLLAFFSARGIFFLWVELEFSDIYWTRKLRYLSILLALIPIVNIIIIGMFLGTVIGFLITCLFSFTHKILISSKFHNYFFEKIKL